MSRFSHLDDNDRPRMVDVTGKNETERFAKASVIVRLDESTFDLVQNNRIAKGNVLAVAQLAGIQAAKKTAELIPLCHNIPLTKVDLDFVLDQNAHTIRIESSVSTVGRTGVEMEALTACSAAALTVYDMVKAVQKDVVIDDLKLLEKKGGKSGDFRRKDT